MTRQGTKGGTLHSHARTSQTRLGLILALCGFMTLSAGDGLVKSMAGEWPGPAVGALRYVIGTLALAAIIAMTRGAAGFAVPRIDLQFARGASVALATLSFFIGAQLMPLADTTAIQFTSPLFVALLSPWLLGERAPATTWLSMLIAMAGVAIVLRPNITALGPAALLPVLAAIGMALLVIFNRRVAGLADVLTLQFWVALMATPLLIASAVIGHFSGVPALRVGVPDMVIILKCTGVAATGTAAHWLIFVATQHASAPVIAPMVYVQLLFAALIGWSVFGDSIDALSGFGMILVIASGLLLWHSQRNPPQTAAAKPD